MGDRGLYGPMIYSQLKPPTYGRQRPVWSYDIQSAKTSYLWSTEACVWSIWQWTWYLRKPDKWRARRTNQWLDDRQSTREKYQSISSRYSRSITLNYWFTTQRDTYITLKIHTVCCLCPSLYDIQIWNTMKIIILLKIKWTGNLS